jgi:hypothetical protein
VKPQDLTLRSLAAHEFGRGRGVVSGYSAAELLGASCGPREAPAELTVPGGAAHSYAGLVLHRDVLQRSEIQRRRGVPVAVSAPRPDEKWGERPKAFVIRRPGAEVNEAELIGYLQSHIARFKVPQAVAFVDALPRTSTGKTQKFELREKEWAGHSSRIQG